VKRTQSCHTRWLIGLSAFGTLLLLIGCSQTPSGSGSGSSGSGSSATASGGSAVEKGRAVYASFRCAQCHQIGGQGGSGGPDLSRVGANPARTPEWLKEHIKNPRAHSPSSRMPGYEGKIPDADLDHLVTYLSSLK
jgi:mono/diheme cytochrome c family protein